MKLIIYILLIALPTKVLCSHEISKKIVIENNTFYFITEDKRNEIQYLNYGSIHDNIHSSTVIELPWSRTITSADNQFKWDIHNHILFCINDIEHAQNDKLNNIKRINIDTLHSIYHLKVNRDQYINMGIFSYSTIFNKAHYDIITNYMYLDTYFSDICVDTAGSIIYLTSIENKLALYKDNFSKSNVYPHADSFTEQPLLLKNGHSIYFSGKILNLDTSANSTIVWQAEGCEVNVDDFIFIINKDINKTFLIKKSALQKEMSLKDIINEYSYCTL